MRQRYLYSRDFYLSVESRANLTATILFKVLFNNIKPKSIIDLGCGSGAWLNAALKSGITSAFGVDLEPPIRLILGNPNFNFYFENQSLTVEIRDLVSDASKPLPKADVAICLEVVEHLPEDISINVLKLLVNSAELIIFSAAQPGQGGTYHINEKSLHYWVKQFSSLGYDAYDPFRNILQEYPEVPRFYALNTLLFVKRDRIASTNLIDDSNELLSIQITNMKQLEKRTFFERVRYALVKGLPVSIVSYLSRRVKY